MKQKIVIEVAMHEQKGRTRAMKIVVGFSGVELAALKGMDKNQIEVIGEEVDLVSFANLLKKKVEYVELVSMSAAENKEEENKAKENEIKVQRFIWTYQAGMPHYYEFPRYEYCVVTNDHESSRCSIMCCFVLREF